MKNRGLTRQPCAPQLLLQTDLMYPVIVEVVFVEEALPDANTKTTKENVVGVVGKTLATDVSHAVVLGVNAKAIEVLVAPIHGNLNRVVQVGY